MAIREYARDWIVKRKMNGGMDTGVVKCKSDEPPSFITVDCVRSAWTTEDINGYKRVCQQLDCKTDGDEPEVASGRRSRRILVEPEYGGTLCSPNGESSLEDCDGNCPGRKIYNMYIYIY